MSNPLQKPLMELAAAIKAIKPELIDAIGVEGLMFIDDNFAAQGFRGPSFDQWPLQKFPNKPRPHKILILTATYRRSWNKRDSSDHTTLFSDSPYARTHNEGLRGPQVVHSKTGKIFTRNQNIPKRQVIGPSPVFNQRCEIVILRKLSDSLPH